MTMVDVYVLDLIGTFVFAVYGAHVGLQRKLNLLGVSLCGFLTAVGGGTVRSFLMGVYPPFYFQDNAYIVAILVGIAIAILTYHYFARVNGFMLVLDAIGLVAFAYIGAFKADSIGLGVFGICFFAGLTAAGGGILRDIAAGKTPDALKDDFYGIVAVGFGLAYYFLKPMEVVPVYGMLFVFFCIRMFGIVQGIHLWVPFGKQRDG